MKTITLKKLNSFRGGTFRLINKQRVRDRDGAVAFVNERNFVFFWPIKGIDLPSLWVAVAGDRPVADAHDDPGHITWGWKDALLGGRAWYYAKVLRKKSTMISFKAAPYFYALSHNYGSPEEDYLTLYEQGRLTQEAKTVYEVLLDEGPLDTIALRRAAWMTSQDSDSRFSRAIANLQADFKILPVGVAQAGGWRYAHIYDIVARHYPELPEQARAIREDEARRKLVEIYFRSVGAAKIGQVLQLFQWRKIDAESAVDDLVGAGVLFKGLEMEGQPGDWIALPELIT